MCDKSYDYKQVPFVVGRPFIARQLSNYFLSSFNLICLEKSIYEFP